MNRSIAIARKELRQLRRDRLTLGMMVMLPLVQLLLFGYAIDTDIRHMPTVVYDQDHSWASRAFIKRFETTTYYRIVGHVRNYQQIDQALTSGRAQVAIVIPTRFHAMLRRGGSTDVQLIVDGSDPQTVGSAINTATGLSAAVSHKITVRRINARGERASPDPIQIQPLVRYNPDQRTAVFIVPGLIGVILTMTMTMLTAMAVARERERGTLEALIVSPAKPYEIVAGKIVPYIAVGYVQMTTILLAGNYIFEVPFRGNVALLFVLSGVFIVANLAVGLLFSTVAKTQQQAMQMSFFFLLPNILLSGFMFPFQAMPRPARWLAEALPLTHFVRIVRRIMLQGAGFSQVSQELYALLGIVFILVVIASARFRKKLL